VSLDGAARPPLNVVRGLARWARAQSYAFLRITHEDADFLSSLDALGGVEVHDPFRRFLAPESELVVRLRDSDEALLASFDESARRYTRRAAARGYDIVKEDSPEALAALWPFFQAHAQRKGLHYRPLERYSTLMALARRSGCASLYVASLEGVTINAILVLRDRDMAHYQLGALDVKALGKNPTPAFLLHHRAMGDARALGATSYNLGIRAGPVYEFKRKFRPEEIFPPPARTIVLRPALYRAWTRVVGRYAPSLMALLRGSRR
jgi:lipid II:glycine glycyltransferase (peptidoglycan interpeptide bridge formation enzyme)